MLLTSEINFTDENGPKIYKVFYRLESKKPQNENKLGVGKSYF